MKSIAKLWVDAIGLLLLVIIMLPCGGWGVAKRRNLLSARMSEVAEYNISWFEYTYKADALKMLNTLKGIGYTTNIGNMG